MRKPLFYLWIALSTLLASPTYAQPTSMNLTDPLPLDPNVRTGKLPNGLTYYIRQNGKPEHRAELRLVIHAGSVLEDDNQQGLAHLNEHMAFNGTKRYPHNTLESFLELHGARFGADLNASTSFDETIYKETLPTDQGAVLDSGMEILSEWAHALSFDSLETEKERGVVGEEWRLGRGAQERIYMKQAPIIFAGSQYAKRSPIGLKAVIDTAHQESIRKFYYDWYRPDLMAVVVVGDCDPGKIEQEIKTLFGPLTNPANERPRTDFPVPPHQETYVAINTDKEMTQTIFSMMFKRSGTDEVTVRDYRKQLVTALYNHMLNARIGELTQKGQAPFAFAGAGDSRFLGHLRAFNVFALLRQDSVNEGVAAVLREVYRAQRTGFGAGELDRAKRTLMSDMEKSWQERAKTKSSSLVNQYVSLFTRHAPAPGIDFEYELYKKYLPGISLDEVNATSPELIGKASRVITFSAPESKDFTPPTREELLNILSSVEAEHLAAYDDKTSNVPLMASMPKAGKIVKEKKLAKIGVTVWTLSNGARVVLKPTDFKDDEILFNAVAPGGSSIAPDADYLSAENADNVVENSGIASFDVTTLEKLLAGKEVTVSPFISGIQEGLQGRSTKKDLETLFQLANLYMTQPRYDSIEASGFISRMKATLENRSKQPESAFSDTLEVTMAQYHHRARPFSVALLNEINLPKAYAYYKRLYADANGFTFFFVGNIDPNAIRPWVEQYLASLPSSNQHLTWKDVGIHPPKGVILKNVYKGTEPKSRVSLVFTGEMKFSRENRFKLGMMAQAFGIKLREDLREEKSGVYGVSVRPSLDQYPRNQYRVSIDFGCDPKRVDELVGEAMKQIDTLLSKPMEDTYLERVRKIGKNELETNLKENNYWMSQLQDRFWNGIEPETIVEGGKLFDSLTARDILETAKQTFNMKNYVQVVLYPEKKS